MRLRFTVSSLVDRLPGGDRISKLAATAVAAGLWTLVSAAPPAQAQEPESEPPAATVPGIAYTSTIEVTGGTDGLKKAIEDTSNLKALEAEPPAGPVGLVRRAQADMQRIQSALNAEGFYGGLISVTVAGVPVAEERAVDAAAAAALRGPVPVTVRVDAGPQFVFGVIALANEATGQPPSPVPIDASRLGLTPGAPARAALVLTAEGRIVDQMQDLGYPLARVANRRAVADHSNNTLDVTFFLAPGQQAELGPVAVRGATTVDPQFVEHMANVKPGTRYSRKEVERIRDEVARLDIFQSVRVIEGDTINPDGTIPLIIQVDERKPRFVGIGASYSSTEGGTVNGYWGHRNLFGHAEKLRLEGEVARLFSNSFTDLQYVAKATFEKPGFVTSLDDLLIEARAFREVPEAYESTGGEGQVSWRRRFSDKFEGRIGVSVEHERITDALGTNTYTLVGIPVSAKYDNTDDKLDPSKGIRALGEVTPYPSFLGSSVGLTVVQGSIAAYHSLDAAKKFILAGRILAGTIDGPNVAQIPANKRFYAGGGGTIRGYDYQGVSPRLPNGEIIGGKSLFVASAEARIKVTETIGIVPFVDAGGAFTSGTPTFNSNEFKVGAGIGLRYYTAIGPLRFDVAVPLDRGPWDPSVAFYVGLGQSF